MPLQTDEDVIAPNLQFLLESKKVLLQRKMSGLACLTKETFRACIHSLETMVELLLAYKSTIVCLTWKFMSDLIEGRLRLVPASQ